MRHCWLIVSVGLVVATPAAADVTATYSASEGRMPNMVIRVNDDGDSRVTAGNQMAVLTVDDETYIVMADLNGVFAVRQNDMMAAFSELIPQQMFEQGRDGEDAHSRPYQIVETGTEMVGGREGAVLAIHREGEEEGAEDRYVVSRDPDLAPIGSVLARQFSASTQSMRRMPGFATFGAHVADVFSRGIVIRMGGLLRLESVDKSPIPPSEFVLPDRVLTREEFVARMGWPTRR